ncbi:MAG: hypothetical protein QN122_11020 [Armatimonadota bacterium]|nr:hypothetical protein [Armatimonadota bacterium]MDR7528734.1 hypothetical protein [Armatimonadota bacterium]
MRLCYTLGWRRGEVFGLERRHVDLAAGALRLEPGETKTREGRSAVLPPDLLAQLRAHLERLDALQRQLGRVISPLFVHLRGRWVGRPIGDLPARSGRAPVVGWGSPACSCTTSGARASARWSGPASRSTRR